MDQGRLSGIAMLLLPALLGAQAPPPDARIVYAPDVVGVERIFLVALRVPPGAPDVRVTAPPAVVLFDQTRPAVKSDVRRFYFRALRPAERAEIRFAPGPGPRRYPLRGQHAAPPSDGDVVVGVRIWSFEELRQFRTLKGVQLPRRWPLGKPLPELKQRQTVTTPEEVAALRGDPGPGRRWRERADDEIWAMQPDSTIPRTHWVNLPAGCPIHGTEVYRERAYYPWQKDLSFPWKWKMRCPVGGEEYPSNDFAAGDMTSGAYPDDGIGGGYRQGDQQYCFIAELAQSYSLVMREVAPECARAYLATGDARYAHKALVALCRLAVEYAYLATMTQHRHHNSTVLVRRLGPGQFGEGPFLRQSGFIYVNYQEASALARLAEAYDRIFPAIDKDPEIIPFLRRKGFDVKTHEDVRRFVEENLFAVWMQGVMDGSTDHGNPGATGDQRGLARAADVLDYAAGAEFLDWLYDGEGGLRAILTNGYFRDGAPPESTGGYNGNHLVSIAPLTDAIERIRGRHPERYPAEKYPPLGGSRRYRHIYDFAMDTVTIDRTYPFIGDYGGPPVYRKLPRITWQNARPLGPVYEHAYALFRDAKLAWALARNSGWQPSPGFPFSRAEVERDAARWPDTWNDRSALYDGYGIASVRGGKGDDKRALWLRSGGQSRGHGHDDVMDLGLDAFQGKLLGHLGYPRNWGYWESSWTTHNLARQIPFQSMTAQAQLVADAGPVHLTEVRAQSFVDRVNAGQGYSLPPDNWQRRLVALIDVGQAASLPAVDTRQAGSLPHFYGVDFYRISGGQEHWWSFHAQEGAFTTQGLSLKKQEGGTLAGPDVPYGDAKWLEANGCTRNNYDWRGPMFGFAHLFNVERGIPAGVWSADWALENADGLHFRLTVPDAGGAELAICDGASPGGGTPYEMKWLMLRRKGSAPVRTQVVSILEPYVKTPLIREARSLPVSGEDEGGFTAAGCVLRACSLAPLVALDRTDTLLFSARPEVARTAGGVRFAGRFGFVAESADGIEAMTLVGGTRLEKGGVALRLERPAYRARIARVDRESETITVAPAPPDLKAILGAQLFITSTYRRSAYRVIAARAAPEGAELQLDLDSRIGTGRVTGVADHQVTTSTAFPLQGHRYYHGARLANAARTAEYRLLDARTGKAAFIDAAAHASATQDRLAREFRAGEWFDIYDYGVGDEVEWPYAVSLTRAGAGLYRLVSPAPVRVTLPAGCRLVSGG